MLHLNNSTVYYWYNGAADMRKSFDALCGIVNQHMQANILQGGVYIFVNRKRNQIKLLTWEGDGLAIYYKRLEKGVYELPVLNASHQSASIDVVQLQLILQGIVLSSVRTKKRFSLNQKTA
jgi:transposase